MDRVRSILQQLRRPIPAWVLVIVIVAASAAIASTLVYPSFLASKPDFLMKPSASSNVTLSSSTCSGCNAKYTVNVISVNGFTGIVTITTNTPSQVTAIVSTGNPTPVVALGSSGKASLVLSSSVPGNYPVSVTGTSGGTVHSISISLIVQDIVVSADPNPLPFYGSPANSTITLRSVNGISGAFSLMATIGRFTMTVSPSTVFLPAGGTATATLTVTSDVYGGAPVELSFTCTCGGGGLLINLITATSLYISSYSFSSGTNATVNLHNYEPYLYLAPSSYTVADGAGDSYVLNYTSPGPNCCPAGATSSLPVLIGSSCSACILSGKPFTFTVGNSYTVTLVTSPSYKFIFTVTR